MSNIKSIKSLMIENNAGGTDLRQEPGNRRK
jgi:hypothetical protein